MNASTPADLEFLALMRPLSLRHCAEPEHLQKKLELSLRFFRQNEISRALQKGEHFLIVSIKKLDAGLEEIPRTVKQFFEMEAAPRFQEAPVCEPKTKTQSSTPVHSDRKPQVSIEPRPDEKKPAVFQRAPSEKRSEEPISKAAAPLNAELFSHKPAASISNQPALVQGKTPQDSQPQRDPLTPIPLRSHLLEKKESKALSRVDFPVQMKGAAPIQERLFAKTELKPECKSPVFTKPQEPAETSFFKVIQPAVSIFAKDPSLVAHSVIQLSWAPRFSLIEIPKLHRIEIYAAAFAMPFFVPAPLFSLFKKREKRREQQERKKDEEESDLDS